VGRKETVTNGNDCGIFAMLCADFLSDDLCLTYNMNDMEFYRLKIAAAILKGSLSYQVFSS
jgi:Ulp1 family protease